MKKLTKLMLITLIVSLLNLNVSAAEIPISKIECANKKIYLLSNQGDLFVSDSIDASTKTLIQSDVIEIKRNGGDTIAYYTKDNLFLSTKEDVYNISVKDLINFDWSDIKYIDNNNNFKESNQIIMENVKKTDEYRILTLDGMLYENPYEPEFIMSDVDDFYADLILKNNGDLYINKDGSIDKVLSNIKKIDCTIERIGGGDPYYVFDNNNTVYRISVRNEIQTEAIAQNAKEIYSYDYHVDYLDFDGNAYKYGHKVDTQGYKITNVDYLGGWANRFLMLFTENNILLANNCPIYEMGEIVQWFQYDNNYVFLNSNGEVWKASKDLKQFTKTQLSEKSTILKVNNESVKLENQIQNVNGRTMYPFRECLNLIGASVYWDGENKIAVGEIQGKKVEFPIGKSEYWINGIKYEMDVPAYVDESIGRTYIPIRYAAEGLGFTVDWIEGETENTISIHK